MLQDDHPIISIIIGIRCERNLEEFQPHKLVKDKNFVAMTISYFKFHYAGKIQ